jgi:hypothetical protein
MLEKIIDGMNKSVTAVANKSEEYVEVAKLKTQISACSKSRDAKKGQLGELVYGMFLSGTYDHDALNVACGEIRAIEEEISILESKIVEVQSAAKRAAGGAQGQMCSSCNKFSPASAKFCTHCGKPFPPPAPSAPPAEAGVTCQCGVVNTAGARFCVACGSPLPQEAAPPAETGVTCSCGLLNKPGAKFCRACGNALAEA